MIDVGSKIGWTLKLVRVLTRLAYTVSSNPDVIRVASALPEERQGEIHVYDDHGNSVVVCVSVGPGGVNVRQGSCSRPMNRVSMHINTLLDLLEQRVDFRTAVAHGAIVIESLDGRPWFYHYTLWSMIYSKLVEAS